MSTAKCPKCESLISEIISLPVNAKNGNRNLKGAVYTCPRCHTILSAGLDPFGTMDETVDRLIIALKKG